MNDLSPSLSDETLLDHADAAIQAARAFAEAAKLAVGKDVTRPDGRVDNNAANLAQRRMHGLAWIATYVETLAQTGAWARELARNGQFGEIERDTLLIGFGEYLASLADGIAMSQNEYVRVREMGIGDAAATLIGTPSVVWFLDNGNTADRRRALVERLMLSLIHI